MNSHYQGKFPILIVVGPTAVGKTSVSVRIANTYNAEIISADSRQIYQGLDVGTGKPSSDELDLARHHLISIVSPHEIITADDFAVLASQAYDAIAARGKKCIVVGGTGLWIRAFIDGLAPTPPANLSFRHQMQTKAKSKGTKILFQELQAIDPIMASRFHPTDLIRIIRALEIFHLTGKQPSLQLQQLPLCPPRPSFWLGLSRNRQEIYTFAEKRIDHWLGQDWLGEVKKLLKQGVPSEAPAFQAIGYSHLVEHIQGHYSWDEVVRLIKRDTRRYIKRQLTWFRAEKRITWLDLSGKDEPTIDQMIRSLLIQWRWI